MEVLAAVVLVASCGVLSFGLWSTHSSLVHQPLWTRQSLTQTMLIVAAYVVVSVALFALPGSMSRLAVVALVVVYVAAAAGVGPAAAALLVIVACLSVGDILLVRLGPDVGDTLRALLSILVGLSLLALVVTVTAHFRVNRPALFVPLLAACIAMNVRGLRRYWQTVFTWCTRRGAQRNRWDYAAAALLGLILLLHSIRAFLPDTGGDGLGMHLVVASQLAYQHQWSFDPAMFTWSLYPLASEWIQGVGWVLGGETAARLLEFAFSIVLVLTIISVCRRFTSVAKSVLAGCLFASAGIAFGLTANTYAEPALAAFSVGAFAVVTLPRATWSNWTSIAFGVLCGASLLTKVTAFYLVVPLFVVLVVRHARGGSMRDAMRHSGIALGAMLCVSLVPYAYAFWRTGNPVFPLYNGIFRSTQAPLVTQPDLRWLGKFSWRLPYEMTFVTSGYTEVFNGTLGFQYLALTAFALVSAGVRRNGIAIAAFFVSLVSAGFFLHSMQYVRYIFPMMAIASIALAAAFQNGEGRAWHWLSRVACVLGVLFVLLNLCFYPGGAWNLPGASARALVSDTSLRQFIDQQAPQKELTAAINALDGGMARVAFLGPAYAAGLQGTPFFAMGYNPAFEAAVAKATTPSSMLGVLRGQKISYVIVPLAMLQTNPALREVLTLDAANVAERNGVGLYRLKP